jgi:hypothetical protein
MAKFLTRITAVSADGRETIYKKEKKNRKVARWLRPMERRQRRSANAAATFSTELLRLHKRSNRKRRNGWLRDGSINMLKATRKASKKLLNI